MHNLLKYVLLILAFQLAWVSCVYDKAEDLLPATTIRLKWNKAYADETQEKVNTGLLWYFHFLGASVPKGAFAHAVQWVSPDELEVNINGLGFGQHALDAYDRIIKRLKSSGEYQANGNIDLGRFIMLTLNSSGHYYAITGMPETLGEFRSGKIFDTRKAAILESSVSNKHRIIELADSTITDRENIAYIASECSGNVAKDSFETEEFEVNQLMPNGQFRFGIYDRDGKRILAADPVHTKAGKPAKCLWCHEIQALPSFKGVTPVPGYYSPAEFTAMIKSRMTFVKTYRSKLKSDVDFSKTQDHTFTELLYISFMEPSAQRLSLEWGLPLSEVTEKLKGLNTHIHAEFPFLGDLYNREEVDLLSPYVPEKVPGSAREKSVYEPDFLH